MTFCPRSMLFVSGEKSDRFAKAMAAGADLVCIDLEDAVHPAKKAEARASVIAWLLANPAVPGGSRRALRVNAIATVEGLRDLLALADSGLTLDVLLIPKVQSAGELQCAVAWVGAQCAGIVPLIETPLGIERMSEIARAGAPVSALMLGGADLSAELGAQFGWDGLLHARGALVNAARSAGLQAWDVPHIDLADLPGLAEETRRILQLGFDCKTAIHPQQIATIHAAFTPSPADIEWAGALIASLPADHVGGAFLFNGRMVDAPVIRKARRIVERAAR